MRVYEDVVLAIAVDITSATDAAAALIDSSATAQPKTCYAIDAAEVEARGKTRGASDDDIADTRVPFKVIANSGQM